MQPRSRHLTDTELLRAIRGTLPFPVYLTKRAGNPCNRDGKRLVRAGEKILATDVVDGESVSGITLVIPLDRGRETLAISLTAVRLEPRHPLYKEIKAYQLNRIASLAAERSQSGRPTDEAHRGFHA